MRAVLDADVLYPLPLRDTLLTLAELGAFQPAWSEQILDEAVRNLIADGRITEPSAVSMCAAMERAFPEAMVTGYQPLIATMTNHPMDRHVAACAVVGEVDLIVTNNLKDFRPLPRGLVAVSPDQFLQALHAEPKDVVARALALQASRLKKNPMSVDQIVERLAPTAPTFAAKWLTKT